MFISLVTLFNYDSKNDNYFATLLKNVEFQPHYKTVFSEDSTQSADFALLIIEYAFRHGKKKTPSTEKAYKSPKAWENLSSDEKKKYFTLKPGEYDFFAKGDYSRVKKVVYENFKNSHDDVFFIHGVRDFEDDLPHFEIEGY